MDEDISFKKIFLITLIVAFSISAIIGIVILILGKFNDTTGRILLTTASIGTFSLLGLCNSVLLERNRLKAIPITGLIISTMGFIMSLLLIWLHQQIGSNTLKVFVSLIIISVTFAHYSLMLLIKSEKIIVNISLCLTLLFISFVALEGIILIFIEPRNILQGWIRLIGVFAIIDILGTICTPIIYKITRMQKEEQIS
jgi:hypothetical protein